MKSIKQKAEESSLGYDKVQAPAIGRGFVLGANYVLDVITECMPRTHSFNPNEAIDIIANRIKELKSNQ